MQFERLFAVENEGEVDVDARYGVDPADCTTDWDHAEAAEHF